MLNLRHKNSEAAVLYYQQLSSACHVVYSQCMHTRASMMPASSSSVTDDLCLSSMFHATIPVFALLGLQPMAGRYLPILTDAAAMLSKLNQLTNVLLQLNQSEHFSPHGHAAGSRADTRHSNASPRQPQPWFALCHTPLGRWEVPLTWRDAAQQPNASTATVASTFTDVSTSAWPEWCTSLAMAASSCSVSVSVVVC